MANELPKDGSMGKAWVTLMTNSSYLAGCLVIQSSLSRHGSAYPFVVLATPLKPNDRLPQPARDLLKAAGCVLREIEYLQPDGEGEGGWKGPDERFVDTWTKLRVAELYEYERVVLIDSDMVVRKNMDELMDMELEDGWIAAAHACTCNPRKIATYPADWIPSNCGFTYAKPSEAGSTVLSTPFQPIATSSPTLHLLNSGLVVLTPTRKIFTSLLETLHTSTEVKSFRFPDQDLLALHFKNKVKFLGYEYNALKTLRDCHAPLWRDEGVRNVHYILNDKPWKSRVVSQAEDFAVVNGWWWDEWVIVEEKLKGKKGGRKLLGRSWVYEVTSKRGDARR